MLYVPSLLFIESSGVRKCFSFYRLSHVIKGEVRGKNTIPILDLYYVLYIVFILKIYRKSRWSGPFLAVV